MRILFFGSPQFAVPTLQALVASSHAVVGVVTQPDRPRGRGQRVTPGAVAAAAQALGLPLFQPAKLSVPGVAEALAAFRADLGVVAAYGKILPDWLLALPPAGMVNVHASLLPAYRGAAPVHRAVIEGARESGVTIMRVVSALDAGPIIDRAVVPIGPDETSAELERALGQVGAPLLVAVVDRLSVGAVVETPQDERAATYAAKITRADSAVAWTRSARAIHDQIRGLHPWPHAATKMAGQRVILHRSVRIEGAGAGPPGHVLASSVAGIDVVAGDGAVVRLTELQAEGGRRLPAADYLAGHPLPAGATFDAL
ncbi:MAG: methionyl-tRNA formyltransferase [Acidobacteriota bacterium]